MEKYRKDFEAQQITFEKNEAKLKKEIEELHAKYDKMKQNCKEFEDKLNQKEGILQELNDIDRFDVLRNTNQILINLSEVLTEVTDEKMIQCQIFTDLHL